MTTDVHDTDGVQVLHAVMYNDDFAPNCTLALLRRILLLSWAPPLTHL